MSELIMVADAASAGGLYSPGLVVGDWIFRSGQGGFEPGETGAHHGWL
jgi:enamine deaminase RidA (YjgF/YER057c/UK114 family)